MKVTSLKIKNVGLIADTNIVLDKPLLLFYGEIRQGKTTILNAVRWVCGGEFPQDIIRHGEKEAEIELGFDGGLIIRSFYIAKDGSTKARAVVFVRNGKPVSSPVSEIKRFLNPFLLDQDFLRNKTDLERRQYFAELFAVDTTTLDNEWFNNDREASALRAKIKGYGEIDLTPVEAVDVSKLQSERAKLVAEHAAKVAAWKSERASMLATYDDQAEKVAHQNIIAANRANDIRAKQLLQGAAKIKIERLQRELLEAKAELEGLDGWLASTPPIVSEPKPERPDVSRLDSVISSAAETREVDGKISNAAAQNVRAEQFVKNQARDAQRKSDEALLTNFEKRQREIKAEKQAKLKTVSTSCGISGLAFDDDGNFIYEGSQAGMLSTSQIMRLSSELSAMYPEGFGIELLDRGESLGRAIFDYVELAKKKHSTVLATIVGEKPAKVPGEVGVFVVKDGVVIPDEAKE